jgi:hypothetical protein
MGAKNRFFGGVAPGSVFSSILGETRLKNQRKIRWIYESNFLKCKICMKIEICRKACKLQWILLIFEKSKMTKPKTKTQKTMKHLSKSKC